MRWPSPDCSTTLRARTEGQLKRLQECSRAMCYADFRALTCYTRLQMRTKFQQFHCFAKKSATRKGLCTSKVKTRRIRIGTTQGKKIRSSCAIQEIKIVTIQEKKIVTIQEKKIVTIQKEKIVTIQEKQIVKIPGRQIAMMQGKEIRMIEEREITPRCAIQSF